MGTWRNSTETQQLAIPKCLDKRSKMEEVVPKKVRGEAQLLENPEGG